MRAATHIMNDDLESAEAGLADGVSSFHKVRYLHYVVPDPKADVWRREECALMTMFLVECRWAKGWLLS